MTASKRLSGELLWLCTVTNFQSEASHREVAKCRFVQGAWGCSSAFFFSPAMFVTSALLPH
jgi:hypothetical protein